MNYMRARGMHVPAHGMNVTHAMRSSCDDARIVCFATSTRRGALDAVVAAF